MEQKDHVHLSKYLCRFKFETYHECPFPLISRKLISWNPSSGRILDGLAWPQMLIRYNHTEIIMNFYIIILFSKLSFFFLRVAPLGNLIPHIIRWYDENIWNNLFTDCTYYVSNYKFIYFNKKQNGKIKVLILKFGSDGNILNYIISFFSVWSFYVNILKIITPRYLNKFDFGKGLLLRTSYYLIWDLLELILIRLD